MDEPRIGRQTPTRSVSIPYTATRGQEAIDFYNSSGRTAQPWQELLIYDILAVNEDGLWVHTKFGYAVPRRNGKNEIVAIRELHGLREGERILHTAHRTTTSAAAAKRLAALLDGASPVQRFRHITLPMLTPVIFFNLVMGIINAFKAFSEALIITDGGPMNETMLFALYIYKQGFSYFKMGYACAMSWVLVVIIAVFSVFVFKSSDSWVHYEA